MASSKDVQPPLLVLFSITLTSRHQHLPSARLLAGLTQELAAEVKSRLLREFNSIIVVRLPAMYLIPWVSCTETVSLMDVGMVHNNSFWKH